MILYNLLSIPNCSKKYNLFMKILKSCYRSRFTPKKTPLTVIIIIITIYCLGFLTLQVLKLIN